MRPQALMLFHIILAVLGVFYAAMLVLCFVKKDSVIAINKTVHKIMLFFAEVALGSMIVIVFITVLLRYCFNTGITWAEEVPGLLVTLFAFCACAIGVRDHLHISVSVVYNLFPKDGKIQKFLNVLYDVCVFECGLFLLYFGLSFTIKTAFMPGSLPMTHWNNCVKYIPVPIAGFLMTFDSILFLTRTLGPDDLFYSEKEVDYAAMIKQNKAEAEASAQN